MKTQKNVIVEKTTGKGKTALETYLTYYKGVTDPGYAVLVTGEWGSGKTYQVKKFFDNDCYYVSLFGLSTKNEIHSTLLAQIAPVKETVKRGAKKFLGMKLPVLIGSLPINLPVGSIVSGVADILLREKFENDKVIVFDDLERSSFTEERLGELLGVINEYVEHYQCRVVVIAHDEKLVCEFSEAKEKIFGQTIQVQPRVEDAMNVFLDQISKRDNDFKKSISILKDYKADILTLFSFSKIQSLRILKQAIEDLVRLISCLDAKYIKNKDAFKEVISIFTVLAFEVRIGRLMKEHFEMDEENFDEDVEIRIKKKEKNKMLQEARRDQLRRYKLHDSRVNILSLINIREMLFQGCFNQGEINKSLERSGLYQTEADVPNWRKVWFCSNYSSAEVEGFIKIMEQEFKDRKFKDIGIILHVFARRLMLASKEVLENKDMEVIKAECKGYINDVADKLYFGSEGNVPSERDRLFLAENYAGLGYDFPAKEENDYERKRADFNELYLLLLTALDKRLSLESNKYIPNACQLLRKDGKLFWDYSLAEHPNLEVSEAELKLHKALTTNPMLLNISAQEFVNAWLKGPERAWYMVGEVVSSYPTSHPKQREECIEWAKKVRNTFKEVMKNEQDKIRKMQLSATFNDFDKRLKEKHGKFVEEDRKKQDS